LCNLTSLCPLFHEVKSKSLKWYGHVKQSSFGLAKQCLEGMIPGKRSRENRETGGGAKFDMVTL